MIPVWPVGPMTNAEPRGGRERRATGVPAGRAKGRGGRGRVAALLAVGLAVAALLTAGPAHAQTPIVPDLSGKQVWFNWYDSQDRPLKLQFDDFGGFWESKGWTSTRGTSPASC